MTDKTHFSAESLLASLRDLESPAVQDPTLKARVHSKLAVSLLGLAPAVTSTCPPPLGADLNTPLGQFATVSSSAVRSSKGFIMAWLAPVFVTGMLAGVLADRWYLRPHTPLVAPSRAVEQKPVAPPVPRVEQVSIANTEKVPVERTHSVAATTPTISALASADPVSTMAAERKLLDAARTALARGEPQSGIAFLTKHEKLFARGTLAEEREALFVRILAAMGDNDRAMTRANRFRRQFPNSIFMPVIERAMNSTTAVSIPRRTGETYSNQ